MFTSGKELMLKIVVQPLLMYVMSVFLLPRKVCNRLMVVMMHFWWEGLEEGKGMHWCSKDRLMRRKEI